MKIGTTPWGHAALALTLVALIGCGGKSSSTNTGGGGGGGGGGTGSTNNQWTWVGGANTVKSTGSFGTQGTASASNIPPARYGIASWNDSASGNFYLFGGWTGDASATNTPSFENDLWKYSVSTGQWTWLSGSNQPNQSGKYGTLGVAAAGNAPGSRYNAASWRDTSGNLWLFGGNGFDANGQSVFLSDLWKYSISTNQWTWMGGASANSAAGVYGTKGVAAAANVPGGRVNALSWTDSSGNFWLFGGAGRDDGTTTCGTQLCAGNLSDLWKYTPSTGLWTWVAGPTIMNQAATYGTKGTASANNNPSARYNAVGWVDSSGNLWLFGGSTGTGTSYTPQNDLWKFSTSGANSGQWTWVAGSNTSDAIGVYGTLGTAAATNTPGARVGSFTWVDASGNLWLFGGTGHDSTNNPVNTLNDLWKFSTSSNQWTWVNGPNTGGGNGSYGTQGTSSSSNIPGSRLEGANWIDSSGNLWLFGGIGYAGGTANTLNDLWKYQP
jgi:N-acetylneuraminic acid mutarotase